MFAVIIDPMPPTSLLGFCAATVTRLAMVSPLLTDGNTSPASFNAESPPAGGYAYAGSSPASTMVGSRDPPPLEFLALES